MCNKLIEVSVVISLKIFVKRIFINFYIKEKKQYF